MLRFIPSMMASLTFAVQAQAQQLSAEDLAAIQAIEEANRTALFEEEFEPMGEAISMPLLTQMGTINGTTAPEARANFVDMMARGAEFYDAVAYDLFIEDRTEGRTPMGRAYALVPTRTVLAFEDGRTVQADTEFLFFEDEGRWYWTRIDNSIGLSMAQAAYPDFAGLAQTETIVTQIE